MPLNICDQAEGEPGELLFPVVGFLKTCVMGFSSFPWTALHSSAYEHATGTVQINTRKQRYHISTLYLYHKAIYTVTEGN